MKLLSPLPPRKTNYKPILLVMLCSFLLGGGSCFGFRVHRHRKLTTERHFCRKFLLCVLVFLGSIVWIVVKAVRESTRGGM